MTSFFQPDFIGYHVRMRHSVTCIDSEIRILLAINLDTSIKVSTTIRILDVIVDLDKLVKGKVDWN